MRDDIDGAGGQAAPNDALLTDARLGKKPADRLQQHYLQATLKREESKFDEIIAVDQAHAVMLTETGIISRETGVALLGQLAKIRRENVDIDVMRGSMLLQIEGHLARQIGGEAAGALSTGRSRIDQGATFRRLYERRGLVGVMAQLLELQAALIQQAAQHVDTVMPGYTHLQPSQPWVFGHYLLGMAERLDIDLVRLDTAYAAVNLCPLGTVGGSGSTWPLDRHRVAGLLGFDGIIENARLGRDIQYTGDIAAAASMLMATLNDLATDLQLWSMQEFRLVELDASYCGTSSIFPQKKNPVALEGVRAAAAGSVQWLANVLSISRGVGSGDLALRGASFLDAALQSTVQMCDLMTGVIDTLIVHKDRMAESAGEGGTTASNLADTLVRELGLSYRTAHHAVGTFVRVCLERGLPLTAVSAAEFHAMAGLTCGPRLTDQQLATSLDPAGFVRGCRTPGGIAPEEVERLHAAAVERLAGSRNRLEARTSVLDRPETMRAEAITAILNASETATG